MPEARAQEMEFFAFDSLRGTLARDHQPRGVFFAGEHRRTYVTYMDHFFDARVTYYDHNAKTWARPVRVDDCRTRDGHNAPAILVTKDGRLHLFYGCHNHPVKYARSVRPEDISEWATGQEIGKRATYTYGVELVNGDLLLFYRFGGAGLHSPLRVHRSADGGSSWDEGTVIVDMENKSWVKIRDTLYDPKRNVVHLCLWEGNKSYWSAYYAVYDPETCHVRAANGADLGPVAMKTELDENGSALTGRDRHTPLDMALHDGEPYFVVGVPSKEDYFFVQWDGQQFQRSRLPVKELGALELYTKDGRSFDLYALYANDPPTGFEGKDLMVWRSEDGGTTWGEGTILVDRRAMKHGLTGLNLTENDPGDGPFAIFQEEWLELSEFLPRHLGSILDDAPFRFNRKLFAIDRDHQFVTRNLTR
jgi:hypothetical protein